MKYTGELAPASPLLEVRNLNKIFASSGLFTSSPPVVAAERISFAVGRGEAVALVGESGSGKTTVARLLLRLESADSGEIRLDGEDALTNEPRGASLAYRGRVQMVFQDPFGSLNPVHRIGYHLERPLLRHGLVGADSRRGSAVAGPLRLRVLELLRTVGLEPAEDFIDRHPYELSGGQRQRVSIARALAVEPDLLVADEPTSMLDVSIRMGVLDLLAKLKKEEGIGIVLITHDLASARCLADRILVLFRGRLVEDGPAESLIRSPAHPYTRALLAAAADAKGGGPTETGRVESTAVPSLQGCPFLPRCPEAIECCGRDDPEPRSIEDRRVRCHLYSEDAVSGRAARE